MARPRGSEPDATIRTLQRAVDQATHVLDHQLRSAEDQWRRGDQAARFAVAIVLFGIAVVGVVTPVEWVGPRWALNLTVAFLTLFFVQAIASAAALLLFSVSSRRNPFPGVGATPGSLREAVVDGAEQQEKKFLVALLELADRAYEANWRRIQSLARKRDLLVATNILSLPWFILGMVIYTSFWIKWT